MRIMNAIEHYKLDITRAAFTGGENTYPYVPAFDAHLFLSANPLDVRKALDAGHAAATILPSNVGQKVEATEGLRIAFDGDAVLFSDEAERVYKRDGLAAFTASEVSAAKEPLSGGPFKSFLAALHRIQSEHPPERAAIRTALVTARSAPAHERVVRTLRAWNIRIDEALVPRRAGQGAVPESLRRRHLLRRPARPRRVGEPARRHRARAVRRRQRMTQNRRAMKILKYTLYAVVGLVALIVIAIAVAVATFDPNKYKGELARIGEGENRADPDGRREDRAVRLSEHRRRRRQDLAVRAQQRQDLRSHRRREGVARSRCPCSPSRSWSIG